jgi:hypothetical protein
MPALRIGVSGQFTCPCDLQWQPFALGNLAGVRSIWAAAVLLLAGCDDVADTRPNPGPANATRDSKAPLAGDNAGVSSKQDALLTGVWIATSTVPPKEPARDPVKPFRYTLYLRADHTFMGVLANPSDPERFGRTVGDRMEGRWERTPIEVTLHFLKVNGTEQATLGPSPHTPSATFSLDLSPNSLTLHCRVGTVSADFKHQTL